MKADIGISEKNKSAVVSLLSELFANEYVLNVKTRNYHWHVTGINFTELHKMFEGQYEALDEVVDSVAERVRALGGNAPATLKEIMSLAKLKEHPGVYPSAKDMLANLVADYEAIIKKLRQDIVVVNDKYQDVGTADFLTGLMEEHEKTAWMLRSSL